MRHKQRLVVVLQQVPALPIALTAIGILLYGLTVWVGLQLPLEVL